MLPMGRFGCETCPFNESAIQKMGSSIADALTYTTSRRSKDLTFVVASGRTDADPDIEVYVRRVNLRRRAVGGPQENKKLADEFSRAY